MAWGRTHAMLLSALVIAKRGEDVVIYAHTKQYANEMCERTAGIHGRDKLSEYMHDRLRLRDGGTIYFRSADEQATLGLRGQRLIDNHVGWRQRDRLERL